MFDSPKMILDWTMTYGLGNVLAIFLAFAFWKVILSVQNSNTKREERLAGIIENHIGGLATAIASVNGAIAMTGVQIQEVKEANRSQREEHKEMIGVLQKMVTELGTMSN